MILNMQSNTNCIRSSASKMSNSLLLQTQFQIILLDDSTNLVLYKLRGNLLSLLEFYPTCRDAMLRVLQLLLLNNLHQNFYAFKFIVITVSTHLYAL